MLDALQSLADTSVNFPRWFDIRKRLHQSDGGFYLRALEAELTEIQTALTEYKAEHFLRYYVGKETTIITQLYALPVGELTDLILVAPVAEIITDVRDFYNRRDTVALWQDGYLLLTAACLGSLTTVAFTLGGDQFNITPDLQTVWNIFDEFAVFNGLLRYDGETNAALLQRIRLVHLQPMNNAQSGLTNAIRNAVPELFLSAEDVVFEPLQENLLGIADADYENAYERLAQINKDTWRTKIWDQTAWDHNFAQDKIIPHAWDKPMPIRQSGIGPSSDLLCDTLSNGDRDQTDVTVTAYGVSEENIIDYLHRNQIQANLTFGLTRYRNDLTPQTAEYRIIASEAMEVDDNAMVSCFRTQSGSHNYWLEDLIPSNDVSEPYCTDRGALEPNTSYRLEFRPVSDMSSLRIQNCSLTEGTKKISLLKEYGVYKFDAQKILTNTDVALHAESVHDLTAATDLRDSDGGGITLADGKNTGSAEIDITGMGDKHLTVKHACKKTNITRFKEFVTTSGINTASAIVAGFSLNDNEQWVSDKSTHQNQLTIQVTGNELSFATKAGSCLIKQFVDGVLIDSSTWKQANSIDLKFETPKKLKVEIHQLGLDQLVIGDIAYNNYSLVYSLAHNSLINGSGGYILPGDTTEQTSNRLTLDITSHTGYVPVIYYIHIGISLKNAVYRIESFLTGSGASRLDIETNASIKLFKTTTEGDVPKSNYTTKALYKNTTAQVVYLPIDTSLFVDVKTSSPTIETMLMQGRMTSVIKLEAGQSLDKILVEGRFTHLLASVSIRSLLLDNAAGNKLYASRIDRCFTIADGKKELQAKLLRSQLVESADTFRITGLPTGWNSVFVLDVAKKTDVIATEYSLPFTELYLLPKGTQYVAYNKKTSVLPVLTGVGVVDLFKPLLPGNALLSWSVSSVTDGVTVAFEKYDGTTANWSLGRKTLKLTFPASNNLQDQINLDESQWSQDFLLSSAISLDRNQTVNGKQIDLAQYNLTPPINVKILYQSQDAECYLTIENDGFNKLDYTNIVSLTGLGKIDYTLLADEGILVWNDPDYYGSTVRIKYTYRSPIWITFTSADYLYEKVGYPVTACTILDGFPKDYADCKNGFTLDRIGTTKACRVIAECSRPNFFAQVKNDRLTVQKVSVNNSIIYQEGWVYDGNKEMYLHHDTTEEILGRSSWTQSFNTYMRYGAIVFRQPSVNYLPESDMKRRAQQVVCLAEFARDRIIEGVSRLNEQTTCENINNWVTSAMTLSLPQGTNGLATGFTALDAAGYAVLDISSYLQDNTRLSLIASGLEIWIGRELQFNSMSFTRSLCISPVEQLAADNGFYTRVFTTADLDRAGRIYLLLRGSGKVDDIIIRDNDTENWQQIHSKNLDRLGFVVTETLQQDSYKQVELSVDNGVAYDQTETDSDGVLRTGSSLDWGLTKLYSASKNWSACSIVNAWSIADRILATDQGGTIETQPIELRSAGAAKTVVVKVNNLIEGAMKDLKITLYSSAAGEGQWTEALTVHNANTLSVGGSVLSAWLKVKVELGSNQIVEDIEIFAEYVETEAPLRVTIYQNGSARLKLTDLGTDTNWSLHSLAWTEQETPGHIAFAVRGLRIEEDQQQWSDWKTITVDSSGVVQNLVEFRGYRYVQFNIVLSSDTARTNLTASEWKVIAA